MKKIFFLLAFLYSANVFAQKDKTKELGFLIYDDKGNLIKNSNNAATYTAIIKANDTTFIARNYKNLGPMIWQQTFLDEELTIPNGRFVWYDEDGNIDSTGIAVHGHKDGLWQYYTRAVSNNGIADSLVKTEYYNMGKHLTKEQYYQDTTETGAVKRNFFKVGKPESERESEYDTTGQRQALFKNGETGWRKYVTANMNVRLSLLIPQYSLLKDNKASVTVCFLVGKDGTIDDVYVLHSAGYPFDREATRVIENSGQWEPAQQNGHPVTYRQKQRIIFQIRQ